MSNGITNYASQRERTIAPVCGVRVGRTSASSAGGLFH